MLNTVKLLTDAVITLSIGVELYYRNIVTDYRNNTTGFIREGDVFKFQSKPTVMLVFGNREPKKARGFF